LELGSATLYPYTTSRNLEHLKQVSTEYEFARSFNSYIDSYCFMVIASSPSPAPLLGSASALGAFRATPGTPHLGLSLGRALYGSSPLTGNLMKMFSSVKPYKPDETRNSCERLQPWSKGY
jgi:hypothetical protein